MIGTNSLLHFLVECREHWRHNLSKQKAFLQWSPDSAISWKNRSPNYEIIIWARLKIEILTRRRLLGLNIGYNGGWFPWWSYTLKLPYSDFFMNFWLKTPSNDLDKNMFVKLKKHSFIRKKVLTFRDL